MAVLNRQEIESALRRLGELAQRLGEQVQLVIVGGAVMLLVFNERLSTRDVDAVIIEPLAANVRNWAKQIAQERDLPDDWLNDGAKGYLIGISKGPTVFSAPGIQVSMPSVAQLIAMKLSAWRDDVDIEDARRHLLEMKGEQNEVWKAIEPYLVPGRELKAKYAFLDLWEGTRGSD
ncbi:MAG TPA: nucleotidyltransferase [Anaerolineae bacterium]|nr:nucleotidyltransferase [Anaerolineae bacterium]